MSKVSVSQAAKLTGKSRETINNATKEGKLSHTRNASNHKVIDIAELERVYPLVTTIDEISKVSATVKASPPSSETDTGAEVALLREKLTSSELMRETILSERERERRQLEDEIETLRTSLEKAQDQHNKALLLITDGSEQTKKRAGDWEVFQQTIEKRLSNHEDRARKQREEIRQQARRKIGQHRRALEEEQAKSVWQKIFG